MNNSTICAATAQLDADMAILKNFIGNEKASRFTDCARVIELVSRELFFAAGIAYFTDANLVIGNHPSIDFFVEGQNGVPGIAAQVTSTANLEKIKKTIDLFEKKDAKKNSSLHQKYGRLYILGLVTAKKDWAKLPSYCTVLDPSDLIAMISARNDVHVIAHAIHAIRSHVNRSVLLTPYEDFDCLQVVLDAINRSAIRNYMDREGSVQKMLEGMDEVSEVITVGSLNGKSISKHSSEYANPDIRRFLFDVNEHLMEIKGMVNAGVTNASGDISVYSNYFVTEEALGKIDKAKESIVEKANKISKKLKLSLPLIKMHGTPRSR
jgi:hypothetical protein